MKVLVIGANGQTGFAVVRELKRAGRHEPVAMIRDADQKSRFDEIGAATVLGDLEKPINGQVEGCDAVVFAAGAGGKGGKGTTVRIDQLGAIRSAVAALEEGAKRFIMLSGLGVDRDATEDPIPHWRRAKGRADDFLRTMPQAFDGKGLDFTIVCPGVLDGDGDGKAGNVELVDAEGDGGGGHTSRATLAAVLAGCLDEPATVGQTFGVIDGDASVADALKHIGG